MGLVLYSTKLLSVRIYTLGLESVDTPKPLSKREELCFVFILVWIMRKGGVNTFKPKCRCDSLA